MTHCYNIDDFCFVAVVDHVVESIIDVVVVEFIVDGVVVGREGMIVHTLKRIDMIAYLVDLAYDL